MSNFSSKDIDEIKNVISYSNNLIIFDRKKADKAETNESLRLSSEYLDAYFNLSENISEGTRKKVIENYIEKNPYYKELKENYNIEIAIARTSSDLSILKATEKSLSNEEESLFFDCYFESLQYYKRILSTEAFRNHSNYRGFVKLFLLFSTVQKYLTRKMDNFFNVDTYCLRDLKNAFISSGLDYFETMPINYQRRLLKKVNDLISKKGTNECLIDIVDIFGFDNITIYKYVLAKGYHMSRQNGYTQYSDPFLYFYKVPHDQEVDPNNDIQISYEKITNDDIYWTAQKEEILDLDFNFVNTKYLSIDTSIDVMKESLNLAYFMNLLFKLQNMDKENELFFYNKNISKGPITLFDSFIALISVIQRSNGYKDSINKNPDIINFVYGYNDLDNKINISTLLSEITYVLFQNKDTIPNYNSINKFLTENFKMKGFNEYEQVSLKNFLEVFNSNQEIRKTLEELIIDTDNYQLYRKLRNLWDIKMKTKINNDIFNGYSTFSNYLETNNYDLYKFTVPDNTVNSQEKLFYFYRDCILEIANSISSYVGQQNIKQAISNSPFIGMSSYIQYYLYTLVSLFKAYTVDLISTDVVLKIDDRMNETVKLFDNADLNIKDLYAERIDLLDVPNFGIRDKFNDSFNFRDEIKIEIIDGEIVIESKTYNDSLSIKDDFNINIFEDGKDN